MGDVNILIIDDEVEFASTLSLRLCLRGYNAVDVHSGTEGLAYLEKNTLDVIILDLKMPDVNGLDILNKIKENNSEIEVIMVTGHGSAAAGIKAMERGAFDYIMKPIELKELIEKINIAISKTSDSHE